LLFFRTPKKAAPQTAAPVVGQGVTAYGQGGDGELRVANGVVREIKQCSAAAVPSLFCFCGKCRPRLFRRPGPGRFRQPGRHHIWL